MRRRDDLRLVKRLALYYGRGVSSRRAALETGVLISIVRDYFRQFHRMGVPRQGRRMQASDFRPPKPYDGLDWIGEAIGEIPIPRGPEWIGKSVNS